jgi:anthranilate synthase component 2
MIPKALIIDNYDSFTYNLVQIVSEISSGDLTVKKNDEITLDEVNLYSHIIISPGPGLPDEAGLLKPIIKTYGATHKILGVCLGLQAIGEVYGAKLKILEQVYHGIQSDFITTQHESEIFENIYTPFKAGRYHSWVIDPLQLGNELLITAVDSEKEIMAIQHKEHQVFGVQFHPESIMTPQGPRMIKNFLKVH